jgi:hypothetical protein
MAVLRLTHCIHTLIPECSQRHLDARMGFVTGTASAEGQTVRVKPRHLFIAFSPSDHEPEQEREDRMERIKSGRFGS